MTKETKTINELKKVNHKLKHQYTLIRDRESIYNSNYQKAKEEIKRLEEDNDYLKRGFAELHKRIDKAIEYIKSDEFWISQVNSEKKLLYILQGSDSNE